MIKKVFKKNISMLLLLLLLLTGCGTQQTAISYQQVAADEAMTMMDENTNYIILDVRTEKEYQQGQIKDAICVPNESIGSEPVAELPDKDQMIFVYCRSGNRSKQAAEKLAEQGYTNIIEFGGIKDWHGEVVSADQ